MGIAAYFANGFIQRAAAKYQHAFAPGQPDLNIAISDGFHLRSLIEDDAFTLGELGVAGVLL